jgi:hypothetical protein
MADWTFEMEARLRTLHPDEMSPLEALRALYELKQGLED